MKLLVVNLEEKSTKYIESIVDVFEKKEISVTVSTDFLGAIDELYKNAYVAVFIVAENKLDKYDEVNHFTSILRNNMLITTIIISTEENISEIDGTLYFPYGVSPMILLKDVENISGNFSENKKNKKIKTNGMVFDFENRLVILENDEKVELTRTENRILETLLKHKDDPKPMNRDGILKAIGYDTDGSVSNRNIDVHIKKIREKIKTNNIISIRGEGYRWVD